MHHSVNSRADVEKLRGTPQFSQVIRAMVGSLTIRSDTAEYPEGYGSDEYEGDPIDPVWVDLEDLSTIERLGFTKEELMAELGVLDEPS